MEGRWTSSSKSAKANGEEITSTAGKLEKALEELQSQQISLGKEMGIQTPAT